MCIRDRPNVLISATGYTGAGGVEIYFEDKNNAANIIWDAIFEIGSPQGLQPIGLSLIHIYPNLFEYLTHSLLTYMHYFLLNNTQLNHLQYHLVHL